MKNKWLLFLIIPLPAFADQLILSNITNGCSSDLNNHTYLFATFSPHQYQCNSGYYVPANNDGCVLCPDVYDCDGGTFTFNENIDQGNKFKTQITGNIANGCSEDFTRAINNSANITATFTPNVHNCSAGYYLPANIDECTICPANSYCPGGTYTFNETTPQGITSCVDSFAPAGMWLASQCGRKLHVGDDVLYLHLQQSHPTQHQLHVSYNNVTYSANAVPRDTNSNTFPKMSNGATHGLHLMIDEVEYLVCDDSVPECVGE